MTFLQLHQFWQKEYHHLSANNQKLYSRHNLYMGQLTNLLYYLEYL